MLNRLYEIRSSTSGSPKRTVYRLTVPREIAERVPDQQKFEVELNEDGLLYRRVVQEILPSWTN